MGYDERPEGLDVVRAPVQVGPELQTLHVVRHTLTLFSRGTTVHTVKEDIDFVFFRF